MAEEITQRLGFNAEGAISQLRKLQEQLDQFKRGLKSTSDALQTFSAKAKPASAALRDLATAAKTARTAMQGLGKAAGVPPNVAASVQATAQQMNSLGQTVISAGAGFTQYSAGVAQGVTAMTSLGKSAQQSSQAVQQGASTTASSAGKVEESMNNAGKAGKKAASLITISWKTVIRVIQAQVIVRALSKIVSTFLEAHDAALELSIAIAEVSTISQGALGPMEQMSASVLALSSNLGIAADEVAEGLYQTLSNQVVEAGNALRFEEQAAKLSIATHSQLKESVNALSSVMNSYNLDVSEVSRVSDVLFKTIELGRLRMGEFGDVLGRVTPLTAALGIKYEEMAAAIAALTQKGVPAHTAITQLTQVSQKLLRPTEKLQELYHQWGVEDGPEAIRRFGGLQGVLLKMKDATAGSSKEFADLLGRVRAMVGALNLTSNEGNALNEALREMEESAGVAKKALEEVEKSAGFKAKKAWNDLWNEVLKFGNVLVEIGTPVAKVLKLMIENFEYLLPIVVALGGAALIMSGKFTVAAAALVGFNVSLRALAASMLGLLPIAVAVGAALAAIYVTKKLEEWADTHTAIMESQKQRIEELTKVQEENTQKRIQSTKKEFEEIAKITSEGWAAQTRAYQKALAVFESSSEAIKNVLTGTLSDLFSQRKKMIDEIKKAGSEADSAIKESMEIVAKTQRSISDDTFAREKKRMSDRQQLLAEMDRAREKAAKAREGYAKAGANEEGVRAARELSNIAEAQAKEAVAHAQKRGNAVETKRAERELERIRGDRIRGEVTFQLERKKLQDQAHKEDMQRLELAGKTAEELIKKLVDLADPMADGVLKSSKQMQEDAAKIVDLKTELDEILGEAFDVSMYESMEIADAMERLKQGVKDAFDKAQIDWSDLTTQLQETISSKVYTVGVKIEIENEGIIQEFVKRFGDIDPLKDPGKFGSQMEQTLKGIKQQYENLQDTVVSKGTEALVKFSSAAKSVSVKKFAKDINDLPAGVEELRQKVDVLANEAHRLAEAGKPFTQEMREQFIEARRLGLELERLGVLSVNSQENLVNALSLVEEGHEANTKAIKASNDLSEIGKETYIDASDALLRLVEHRKDQIKAEEAVTDKTADTKVQLEEGKQAVVDTTTAAGEATTAIAGEAEQARQLKIELQGASQAQKELTQAELAAPVEAAEAAAEAPAVPEKTEAELKAQAEAARQLTAELVKVDNQFATVLLNIDAVTQAMSGTSEIAAQMAGSMEQVVWAVDNLQFGLELVTQQIGLGIESVGNLNIAITDSTTAINSASSAAANWASQLNNCASAGYAAASAMQAAASAANTAASACASASAACSGGSAAAYYGGPSTRYRHEGGFSPRGQDRIPIMAAPGEFIMNARNARRFSSQLQAMNAGREPTYRDQGGSITNIGDINVSVQERLNARLTARDIATGLRRELRRGTSRLRP